MTLGAKKSRIAIGSLTLSFAAGVALLVDEGFTDRAVIPVKGDVPTVAFGMTERPDGSPVQMGDRATPVEGLKRSLAYIQRSEGRIKQCVTAPVSQVEYDQMVDFSFQYGVGKLCNSSMVRLTNEGRYAEACEAYLAYRFAAGYDCSTLINGQPNKRCWGVWTRQLDRRDKCVEALG